MTAPRLGPLDRWRLVLGEAAEPSLPRRGDSGGSEGAVEAMDVALAWLYDRDADRSLRGERSAGRESSRLSVPDWILEIHRLFPRETVERLERDAVERYRIDEIVTNPDVLARVEPNQALLEAVLRTKNLMRPHVLELARQLVREVVRQLVEALAREIRVTFAGALDRRRRSSQRFSRNFDFRRTLRANLGRWSPQTRRLMIERPLFFGRIHRHADRWQIVLLVDQSGSMLASVIHAAVTAACLWGLPGMTTHLVAFDTHVVDLTQDVTDPVELLMKVQLGGGTDIAKAVAYAADLITSPRRALVVLITDLYEGGSPQQLVRLVASLVGQGTRVLVLAALDEGASPVFDRELGQRLVDVGAQVGAMTPGQLAAWIAVMVRA